jgi:DNA-binding MarR family transcriptional regulator
MTSPPNDTSLRDATEAALVASRAMVAIAAQSLNELDDVTLPQYRALLIVASRGPCTSGELAGALGVHASTVTRLVDRLLTKGLLDRAIPSDRREVMLSVTPAAVAVLDAVTTARRTRMRAVLRRMPVADRAAVLAAFAAFAAAAGEVPDDQWSIVLTPTGRP